MDSLTISAKGRGETFCASPYGLLAETLLASGTSVHVLDGGAGVESGQGSFWAGRKSQRRAERQSTWNVISSAG